MNKDIDEILKVYIYKLRKDTNTYIDLIAYEELKKLFGKSKKLIISFFEKMLNDMSIFCNNFDESSSFEKLKLNKNQKKKMDGNIIWSYRYINKKALNIRCIFYIDSYNNNIYILKSFFEDGDKTTGKKSYNSAIDDTINRYRKKF